MIKRLTNKQYNTIKKCIEYFSAFSFIDDIYLFGSCARGDNSPESDADIYIAINKDCSDDMYYEFDKNLIYLELLDDINLYCENDIKTIKKNYDEENMFSLRNKKNTPEQIFWECIDKYKVLIYSRNNNYKLCLDEYLKNGIESKNKELNLMGYGI